MNWSAVSSLQHYQVYVQCGVRELADRYSHINSAGNQDVNERRNHTDGQLDLPCLRQLRTQVGNTRKRVCNTEEVS